MSSPIHHDLFLIVNLARAWNVSPNLFKNAVISSILRIFLHSNASFSLIFQTKSMSFFSMLVYIRRELFYQYVVFYLIREFAMIGFSHPLKYPPLHMKSFHSFIIVIRWSSLIKIASILWEDASFLSELWELDSREFFAEAG